MPRAVPDDYPVEQSDEQFTIFIAGVNPKWFAGVERNLYRFHRGLRPSGGRPVPPPRHERSKPGLVPVPPVKTPTVRAQQQKNDRQLAIAIRAETTRRENKS